jgi:hypothetical protein
MGRLGDRGLVEVLDPHRNEVEPFEIGGRRRTIVLGARAVRLDQLLERGPAFLAVTGLDRLSRSRHGDEVRQHVARRQQHIGHVRGRVQAAAAHRVEHGLEHVGELDQRLETEDAGAALHRMNGAEDRVDGLVRCPAFAHLGEAHLDVAQGFGAFVEERLLQLFQTCHGFNSLPVVSSSGACPFRKTGSHFSGTCATAQPCGWLQSGDPDRTA